MGTSSCIQDLGVELGLQKSLARLRGFGQAGQEDAEELGESSPRSCTPRAKQVIYTVLFFFLSEPTATCVSVPLPFPTQLGKRSRSQQPSLQKAPGLLYHLH